MQGLIDAAVRKRRSLLTEETDAVRLVDGAGDGLPGVFLETHAGKYLLSSTTDIITPPVSEWLLARDAPCYLKLLDQHQKLSPRQLCGPAVEEPFLIRENGVLYEVSFQSGYSQGIFLDQRDNRADIRNLIRPGQFLLNAFAYTGAFSVVAALAGAETTTLDLSQPYLDWAKRNFSHNGLDPAEHHFCKGDTFHWLRRFAKQGRLFDVIVLDPPTFSRDETGRVFRAERDFGILAALAAQILTPCGRILCSCNFRGLASHEFARRIVSSLPRPMAVHHSPMPPDFTGEKYLKSVWLTQD